MQANPRTTMVLTVASVLTIAVGIAHARDAEPASLSVTRAALFSSGVGYFEHEGVVHGDADMRIMFKDDQINDVLKSMLLLDFGGGSVAGVTYTANDPLERALKGFGVDISANPALPDLLDQLRGSPVIVHAPERIDGVILNVERRTKVIAGQPATTITEHVLNIVSDGGIRSVPLSSVHSVEIADPKLREELNAALTLLAASRDTEQKPMDIRFRSNGVEGGRRVRVGYIVESPVWKTSYRLDMGDESPLLQGWAIVENMSNSDWENVRLSLVSGRPISFVQDLYTPLYATRPVVRPQLFAGLRPRVHEDAVLRAGVEAQFMEGPRRRAPAPTAGGAGVGGGRDRSSIFGDPAEDPIGRRLALESSAVSMAEGANLGELFSFTIEQPVTIARRRSAMLPIVTQTVAAERISIYNADVLDKHPLSGAWVTNTTGLKLPAGPMTVFDGGAYAGDAQVDHLSPGDKRLVSYGVDLDVLFDGSQNSSSRISTVRIVQGVMQVIRITRYDQTYAVRNKADRAKHIIIEHPFHADRTLIEPATFEEKTPEHYRFRIALDAGEAKELLVREDVSHMQTMAILNQQVSALQWYVTSREIEPRVQQAIARAIELKQALSSAETRVQEIERSIRDIVQGQERLRENLKTVGNDSPLGRRYLTRLGEDEDRLEALGRELQAAQADVTARRTAMEEYLRTLNVA